MSRDDSVLYTGATSASRRSEKVALRRREKAEKQAVILPNEKIIMGFLDEELKNTKLLLLQAINPSTPSEDVKSLIVSLNLLEQNIQQVKNRVSGILRRSLKDIGVTDEPD
jgi:hypothetical protein